jgi:hypothetical protein
VARGGSRQPLEEGTEDGKGDGLHGLDVGEVSLDGFRFYFIYFLFKQHYHQIRNYDGPPPPFSQPSVLA